jgi:hypothetical protein
LESIVTGPNDEWPIHPDNEWPVRPDPEAENALYVPSDETEQAKKPRSTRNKLMIAVAIVFYVSLGCVFFFLEALDSPLPLSPTELTLMIITGVICVASFFGFLALMEDDEDTTARTKALREAKPRRALITDDVQSAIIDLSTHKDGQVTKDGEWPVLQQQQPETPKPAFEPYEPDKSFEEYWPHVPLPEGATLFQKVRRVSWITAMSVLAPLVISVIIGIADPTDEGFPEVQLIFAGICAFFFCIAYVEQLFTGDH